MSAQPPHDDLTVLRQRLQLLLDEKSTLENGKRVLEIDEAQGALEGLKREVFETQLPRLLTFENTRGEILSLEVAGGRVLRGGKTTTQSLVEAHANMGGFLSARRQDDHAAIMRVICSFAAGATRLTVDFAYLEEDRAEPAHGFDIAGLVDTNASKDTSGDASTAGFIPDFIKQCQDVADAGVLWVGAEKVFVFGKESLAELLTVLSENERASAEDQEHAETDAPQAAHFVIYEGDPEGGFSVLCATEGDALGLLRFDQNQLGAILKHWPGVGSERT